MEVTSLPIDQIDRNPEQPRRYFDEDALNDLARSIAAAGLLEPIVVRRENGRYRIVAGERRWRAAQRAGLTSIPAVVRDVTEEQAALLALAENAVREDLNVVEEGEAYRQLRKMGFSDETIAEVCAIQVVSYVQRKVDVVERCVPEVLWLVKRGMMNGTTAWRLTKLSANGQRAFLQELQRRPPMTEAEEMGLVEALSAAENQTVAFAEVQVTEEQVKAARSFVKLIEHVVKLAERLEKLEAKQPGALGAAVATEIDLVSAKLGHLQDRLGRLKRVVDRARGRRKEDA